MAALSADGMTRVWWVSTISNTAAPTTSELAAGVALETLMPLDGLNDTTSTDAIDTTTLASTQDTEAPGRRKDGVELTFFNAGESAVPWTTFASRPAGYVVTRRGVAQSTAAASGQKLKVIPVQAGDRQAGKAAKNEFAKFTVPFFVTGAVVDTATIA